MRRTFFLLATIGTAFLLAGGVALVSTAGPGKTSVAEAQTKSAGNSRSETATGVLDVQWGDPKPGSGAKTKTKYTLTNDRGQTKELLLDRRDTESVGGPLAFKGKRVKVKGERVSSEPERVQVQEIEFERPADAAEARSKLGSGEPPAAEALTNGTTQPWVTIGCRFKDSATVEPKPMSYFENLMGLVDPPPPSPAEKSPELDHYWSEISFGNINLTGSKVVGWYTLPGNKSNYVKAGSLNRDKVLNDCTAVADPYVKFTDFFGINLVLNQDPGDHTSWGGTKTLTRDLPSRQIKTYGVTWLPPFAYGHDWVAHEMGHGFGMPHSSGPYSATYDSDWDVMSGSGECDDKYPNGVTALDGVSLIKPDPKYSCISVHTIAYNKDLVGWIPPNRKYMAAPGSDQTITIDRLGQALPASGSGYLMAQVPIRGSATQFYTVEARRFAGYDGHENGKIPGEAIVIHKVNTTLSDRDAKVVDRNDEKDANGYPAPNNNPSDKSAMWLPSGPPSERTFTDATNGITIEVTDEARDANGDPTGTGYKVRVKVQ